MLTLAKLWCLGDRTRLLEFKRSSIVIFMAAVTLQAHFDGRNIVLDEPYDLPTNAQLMVTVLPSASDTDSEEAWLRAASSSDAFKFLDDPAEDIYSLADGKPFRDAV